MLKMKKVPVTPDTQTSPAPAKSQDSVLFPDDVKRELGGLLSTDLGKGASGPGQSSAEPKKHFILKFEPTVEFEEKSLARFAKVSELQFLHGFKSTLCVLRSKHLPRDEIVKIVLAAPGILLSENESFLGIKFPNLKCLEVLGCNKQQSKMLSDFLQHICLYSSLTTLKLETFTLDGTIKMPYSLSLKSLRIDLTGKKVDNNQLNIFFPVLSNLELYYGQDYSGRQFSGSLRVLNFPSLKKLTLKNLRPLVIVGKEPLAEKYHLFSPFEGKKWKTVTHLTLDFLSLASFAALNETFENISHLHIIVGSMDFLMLPGKTTEYLPRQATSVTFEAHSFGLVDPYDPNPFYENVTHLVLKLEEFDMRTLSTLTTLECLKDLSLILVQLTDGTFSSAHPEYSDSGASITPSSSAANNTTIDHGKRSYPPSEIDGSEFSADFDGTFETLEVLRVTFPSRMHQFIVWIATQSPYIHTLIASDDLPPATQAACLAQVPSLSIYFH